jgi:hypothetical protein
MHKKLQANCNLTLCKDRLTQLQNLLKTEIEGDYKVLIMEDIMEQLLSQKKEKEALAIADQAKSNIPNLLLLIILKIKKIRSESVSEY